MSESSRKVGRPRKVAASGAEWTEEVISSNRRTSSRLNKVSSGATKDPLSKDTRYSSKIHKVSQSDEEEEEEDISPQKSVSTEKKTLLLSPRTTALTEKVEALTISAPRRGRPSKNQTEKSASVNLKCKVVQKIPQKEKKTRPMSSTSPERTPEKKAKISSDSSSSDSEDEGNSLKTSSCEGPLKGRVEEFKNLKSWILNSKRENKSLSIYISGQPGTGKTATTMRVLTSLGNSIRSCVINCASTNTKAALFKSLFDSLGLKGKPSVEVFEEHVKSFKIPLVLVLDEIDHLANRKNASLYAAFQWPDTLSHKIIILGIANSIDLTERLLPKLMLTKPPRRLVFEPYTKDDIVEILNEKMKNEDAAVDAKAIELTARKVAAMSGDLRTALHIFKQQKSRLTSSNEASVSTPVNGCREVLGIINSVYSSPLARARLPLQPRILLAVSLALSSKKFSSFDRNSLLRAYYKACEAIRVPALDDDDLHAAFQTLESQSFVRQLNGGKLVLQVDAPTARSAISDNAMLDQIGLIYF